jgi:lysophospholipase L1-like esterase
MSRIGKIEKLAALALVLASVVAFLAAIELTLRWSVPYLPLCFHKYLSDDIFVLAQRSKRAFLPRDYVAIFGDSYAQGAGDWYAQAVRDDWGDGLAYQAAHVIFELTGRDVINFGVSGAGSFDGLVYYPLRFMAKLAARGIELERPQQIVAYFYEGNDLSNNLNLLRRYWPERSPPATFDQMSGFLTALLRQRQAELERPLQLSERLYLNRFFAVLYADLARMGRTWLAPAHKKASKRPPATHIRLGDAIVALPQPLHSAALDLSEADVRHALLVFQASLALAKARYAPTPILLVYLPAPLTAYRIVDEQVPVDAYEGPNQIHPSEQVYDRSNQICAQVSAIAQALKVDFLDARPFIQALARDALVHGPGDWKHFNRAGYEALGRLIAQALEAGRADGGCRSLYP